jgi:hypothetical protein
MVEMVLVTVLGKLLITVQVPQVVVLVVEQVELLHRDLVLIF